MEEAYADQYWSTYRQHIHTLLAWGYADSRNRVQPKHDEPDITGFNDYLGEDGLQCFLRGRYAHESDEAGMLGYIQCDNISIWVERLQLAIDQSCQDKNEILLLSPQRNVRIVDAFPQEWMSKHDRHTGKSIVIHHILLDYCITVPTGSGAVS